MREEWTTTHSIHLSWVDTIRLELECTCAVCTQTHWWADVFWTSNICYASTTSKPSTLFIETGMTFSFLFWNVNVKYWENQFRNWKHRMTCTDAYRDCWNAMHLFLFMRSIKRYDQRSMCTLWTIEGHMELIASTKTAAIGWWCVLLRVYAEELGAINATSLSVL